MSDWFCGGCGETDQDKRCLGCLHEMPTRTDSIPLQDDLIRAALEVAAEATDFYSYDGGRDIRALADKPEALAAIKVKAKVRR